MGQRRYAPPAALGWSSTFDFTARKTGSTYAVTLDPASLVSADVWSGPAFYLSPTGSDAADGLTESTPLKSFGAAITKGRTAGVPFRIIPAAGTYDRAISNIALSTTATPDFAILPSGGRAILTGHESRTYADDGSGTNTYSSARTAVAYVVETDNLNSFGDYTDLVKQADADVAAVRATPGSWCQDGANVYVHRYDGVAPTDSNTRVYLAQSTADFSTINCSIYAQNIDWEGGAGVRVRGGTRNVAFVNCTSKYMGWAAANYDGFLFSETVGLAYYSGCTASSNSKDAFNAAHPAVTTNGYVLTLNCIGNNNGRFGSTSNNGITAHNAYDIWCDIGGKYNSNVGANVAMVGGSNVWCLGTATTDGDTRGFWADGSGTEMWLENTRAADTDSVYASTSAVIRKRNHISDGAETQTSSGTIVAF